jgi:mannose/cellobiose epimerase-like protein (N-acyl-D-glucosamine 2-epimerase family)
VDGLYRTLVTPDGVPVDDRAVLYDQAFALLCFASAYAFCGEQRARTAAYELHDRLWTVLAREVGGFEETEQLMPPLTSNSHMHLLEASMAWFELDADARWLALAAHIVELALTRWIDARTGAIREFFGADWRPLAEKGRIIEPGHQFEWAWLLLRFAGHKADARLAPAALRLVEFGETFGIDRRRRVAINVCLDDGQPFDVGARLWPQTERIKAACAAGEVTGDASYFRIALEATKALMTYFDTPRRGLWRDRLNEDGRFVEEPAPASSFYHIVGAAAELKRALRL